MYILYNKQDKTYVLNIIFNDCGVGIEFTHKMSNAAKVSIKEVAEHLTYCYPIAKLEVLQLPSVK